MKYYIFSIKHYEWKSGYTTQHRCTLESIEKNPPNIILAKYLNFSAVVCSSKKRGLRVAYKLHRRKQAFIGRT